MKSKSTILAATIFAAVAFTVPAAADVMVDYELGTIDGVTYTTGGIEILDDVLTITNGGVLLLMTNGCADGSLSIVITNSAYLVSDSEDSTAAVSGGETFYSFIVYGDVEISFDSVYLADLVAGTATEYTYQIFDSTVLSGLTIKGEVTVDDSWQNTTGVVSVTYDESTGTVTVVVPEPGAFGMLAGIAALAFTAARRPRRVRLFRKTA